MMLGLMAKPWHSTMKWRAFDLKMNRLSFAKLLTFSFQGHTKYKRIFNAQFSFDLSTRWHLGRQILKTIKWSPNIRRQRECVLHQHVTCVALTLSPCPSSAEEVGR